MFGFRMVKCSVFEWFGPFKNRISKRLELGWRSDFRVRFLSPHCIGQLNSFVSYLLPGKTSSQYSGGWNTERVQNFNGNPLFDFPVALGFPMVLYLPYCDPPFQSRTIGNLNFKTFGIPMCSVFQCLVFKPQLYVLLVCYFGYFFGLLFWLRVEQPSLFSRFRLTSTTEVCVCFFSLILPTKRRYRDVKMRAVTIWGQERDRGRVSECPTCE